ncbi:hypothetical protein, unlikely [Trypanosoma brucei gambiense DAL972]|uniref:Uncharacterized protein n=1 Tax=Trypanosoma brucei gambiense (strain MHOM/CI/86/DAL972) TaxID=679716 RepID=D0A880_TRYB9|nr:hypothetical protein, unlikely [Trypanosoma brucei gambiense DAL972]CBH17881.1 hypothetical protein, unlikely [Trypanosoma brucei gambiense DAL972]|eukprot:XP_011780145.1 hypothetical protein, unlikely [Trypanosoma brucei gambiense DAL972]
MIHGRNTKLSKTKLEKHYSVSARGKLEKAMHRVVTYRVSASVQNHNYSRRPKALSVSGKIYIHIQAPRTCRLHCVLQVHRRAKVWSSQNTMSFGFQLPK